MKYLSEADANGKRLAECELCGAKWNTHWPLDRIHHNCPAMPRPIALAPTLTPAEVAELFPNEDPTLLGNRIKALTEAVGIPACGGCDKRREYINRCHQWLRSRLAGKTPTQQP